MAPSTKKICITAMGTALFVVLSLCLQVPVFENYYLCLGYVVMTLFCYYFGPISGMTVGGLGVVLYCLLTSGLRGMPGWAIGNLVIGLFVGLTCKFTLRIKKQWIRHIIIGISVVVSVAVAMLGVKSLVEAFLYAQPMLLRIAKNFYAFIADVVVMIISLPICISLKNIITRAFSHELMGIKKLPLEDNDMAYDLNKIKIKRCSYCEEYYCCAEDESEFDEFLSKTKCDKCGAPLFGHEEDGRKYVKLQPEEKIGAICFDLSHTRQSLHIQWEILGKSYNRGKLYYRVENNKLLLYIANKFNPDNDWLVLTEDVILNIRFNEIELYYQVTRRKYNISDDIEWALINEKEQFGKIIFEDDSPSNSAALLWLLNTPANAKYIEEVNKN